MLVEEDIGSTASLDSEEQLFFLFLTPPREINVFLRSIQLWYAVVSINQCHVKNTASVRKLKKSNSFYLFNKDSV